MSHTEAPNHTEYRVRVVISGSDDDENPPERKAPARPAV
jgi:hypothetical protein